jgi:hypothetical protein
MAHNIGVIATSAKSMLSKNGVSTTRRGVDTPFLEQIAELEPDHSLPNPFKKTGPPSNAMETDYMSSPIFHAGAFWIQLHAKLPLDS